VSGEEGKRLALRQQREESGGGEVERIADSSNTGHALS